MSIYSNAASDAPASDVMAVTPTDGAAVSLRQLYITGAGTLKIDTLDTVGRVITVPAGFTLTCVVKQVYATGTTCTGIIGFV